MTITPLHQLTYLSDTFHTSLVTVTLSDNCHTSQSTCTPLHQLTPLTDIFHTSLRTVTPPQSHHTLRHPLTSPMTLPPLHRLTYLSNTFLIIDTPPLELPHFLIIVTPPKSLLTLIDTHLHTSLRTGILPDNRHTSPSLLTSPPWPSHLPTNWHTFLISFTLPFGLSHSLSTVTPPWWQSCITNCVQQLSHFPNSFHPSKMALTLSVQPSYHMYIFHTSLTTSHFSDSSPSNLHTSHTLLIILILLQLAKHIPHDYHTCPITVSSFWWFNTLMWTVKLSDKLLHLPSSNHSSLNHANALLMAITPLWQLLTSPLWFLHPISGCPTSLTAVIYL